MDNARHGQRGFPGHHRLHGNRDILKQVLEPDLEPRAVGGIVSATIDGKLVSWTNEYDGTSVFKNVPATSTVAAVAAPEKVEAANEVTSAPIASASSAPFAAANTAGKVALSNGNMPSTASGTGSGNGNWARQAYFNAGAGTAEGITFLNHFGGVGGIPGTAAGGSAFVIHLKRSSSSIAC